MAPEIQAASLTSMPASAIEGTVSPVKKQDNRKRTFLRDEFAKQRVQKLSENVVLLAGDLRGKKKAVSPSRKASARKVLRSKTDGTGVFQYRTSSFLLADLSSNTSSDGSVQNKSLLKGDILI